MYVSIVIFVGEHHVWFFIPRSVFENKIEHHSVFCNQTQALIKKVIVNLSMAIYRGLYHILLARFARCLKQ